MKRTKGLKRTPLKQVSKRRAIELKQYAKLRREYLAEHTHCEVTLPDELPCWKRSEDVHHKKGRHGRLLLNRRWWLPVCRSHHDWIENNKREARKLGLILYK